MRRPHLWWVGILCLVATVAPALTAQGAPATLGFTLSPAAGPPGTLVRFSGDVPTNAPDFSSYQVPGFAYGLESLSVPTNPSGCELIVGVQQVSKTVSASGHVTGSFVVGDTGGCFMSPTDLGPQPARPGVYEVLLSCHACTPAGTFTVTSTPIAVTGSETLPVAATGAGFVMCGLLVAEIGRRRRALAARRPQP